MRLCRRTGRSVIQSAEALTHQQLVLVAHGQGGSREGLKGDILQDNLLELFSKGQDALSGLVRSEQPGFSQNHRQRFPLETGSPCGHARNGHRQLACQRNFSKERLDCRPLGSGYVAVGAQVGWEERKLLNQVGVAQGNQKRGGIGPDQPLQPIRQRSWQSEAAGPGHKRNKQGHQTEIRLPGPGSGLVQQGGSSFRGEAIHGHSIESSPQLTFQFGGSPRRWPGGNDNQMGRADSTDIQRNPRHGVSHQSDGSIGQMLGLSVDCGSIHCPSQAPEVDPLPAAQAQPGLGLQDPLYRSVHAGLGKAAILHRLQQCAKDDLGIGGVQGARTTPA